MKGEKEEKIEERRRKWNKGGEEERKLVYATENEEMLSGMAQNQCRKEFYYGY